jgi:hypothetical protein
MEAIEEFILGLPREYWLVIFPFLVGYLVFLIFNKLDDLKSAIWDLVSRTDEVEANQEDTDLEDEGDW